MNEPPKQRAAFLDRDGTLITDVHFLADPDGIVMMPNADLAVRALNDAGVLAIVVTNQSGIARGLFTEEQYQATAQRLREVFATKGARIDAMYHCPHHPDFTGPCECRKPGTLLFRRAAAEHDIDVTRSGYIGDRLRDIQPAQTLGGLGIMVPVPSTPPEELETAKREFAVVDTLMEAVRAVLTG